MNASTLRRRAQTVMRSLLARGETLSTAESCTGGLVAKAMTDLSGSSAVFSGAFVTYTNEVKIKLLGVDPALIERESEVSAACAMAMAEGARARIGSTYALSLTGYAGPGGGTDADPVGTVYIGFATKDATRAIRFSAPTGATRSEVRLLAAIRALELLEEELRK